MIHSVRALSHPSSLLLEQSAVLPRDALHRQQDDHGVRGAAAVVGGEAGPEGEQTLLLQQLTAAVEDALVLRASCRHEARCTRHETPH